MSLVSEMVVREYDLAFVGKTSNYQVLAGSAFRMEAFYMAGPDSTNLTAMMYANYNGTQMWVDQARDCSAGVLVELSNPRTIPSAGELLVAAPSGVTGVVRIQLFGGR